MANTLKDRFFNTTLACFGIAAFVIAVNSYFVVFVVYYLTDDSFARQAGNQNFTLCVIALSPLSIIAVALLYAGFMFLRLFVHEKIKEIKEGEKRLNDLSQEVRTSI